MSVKNKQNPTVKFLVRAELLNARPTVSGDHYTPGEKTLDTDFIDSIT